MSMDNLSAVLHGAGDLRLEQTPIPEPTDNDVQFRVGSVGICGTDIHYYLDGRTGRFIVHSPIVLGHETSGTVTKVGKNVKHLKVGDRVAIEPNFTCRTCEFCKRGTYNFCPRIDFTEVTPYRGTLRRYALIQGDLAFKQVSIQGGAYIAVPCDFEVPDCLTLDEAALIEPFAVAVHACTIGNVSAGQKIFITGSGPIGLLCMAAAKAYGVDSIVQTDIVDAKLTVAKSIGADHTVNVKGLTPEQVAKKVEVCLGGQPDISIECTGQETCLQSAVYATKPGGSILVVGMGPPLSNVPIMEAVVKEIKIQGVFCYANNYPTAISLLASGRINLKPLITHRYPLEKVQDALDHAISGRDGAVKIILNC